MKLGLTEYLPAEVRRQVEDLISGVSASWQVEHREDGTHEQVSAQGPIISASAYGSFSEQPRARCIINFDTPTYGISPNNTNHQVVFYPTDLNFGTTLLSYDNGSLYGNSFLQPGAAGAPSYDRIVPPPVPGMYMVIAEVGWQPNAAGWRRLRIRDQAGTVWGSSFFPCASNAQTFTQQVACVLSVPGPPVIPWTYYYLETFQDSGIDLDITGWLQIHKLS